MTQSIFLVSSLLYKLRFKTFLRQHSEYLLDMLMAACLQNKIHFRALNRQMAEGALMMHFLDVGVDFGEARRDLRPASQADHAAQL